MDSYPIDLLSSLLVEQVERHSSLRRCGKELFGHCPLHDDRHPSMRVNPEKGVWYCPVCNVGGDVFTFLQKVEGFTFLQALAHLGLTDQPKPTRAKIKKREAVERASRNLVTWALSVSESIGARMRELGQRAYRARKVLRELPGADEEPLLGEIENCERQWDIVQALDDDLHDPAFLLELWKQRDSVEVIAHG